MDRRRFLGAAAAACSIGPGRASAPQDPEDAAVVSAVEGRAAGVALRSSIAAYSFRGELGADPPRMELAEVVDLAAREGLDAVELTSYWFRERSEAYAHALRRRATVNGLAVSGMPIRTDFARPAGSEREREREELDRWLEVASALGAQTVRVFAGSNQPGLAREEARKRVVEELGRAVTRAEAHGVVLALENHGFLTETAADLLALVRGVDSPWLGINLDTGNFVRDGYAELAVAAPYAVACQVKLELRDESGTRVPCDFSRVAGILRAAGYRGYVALEDEGSSDPRIEVPRHLRRLCEALRS